MKQNLLVGAGLCLVTAVVVAYATATMGGQQYSLNIHFVPPLVTGACRVATFWNPPNVTCALCFCMTGTLSRCIPQPGCIPSNATNNATTTTASPSSSSGTSPNTPATVSNVVPGHDTMMVTPAPAQPAPGNPTAAPGPGPADGGNTSPPVVATNFVRKRRSVRKIKAKF